MYQRSPLIRFFVVAFLLSFSYGVEGKELNKNHVGQPVSSCPFKFIGCPPTEQDESTRDGNCEACWGHCRGSLGQIPLILYEKEEYSAKLEFVSIVCVIVSALSLGCIALSLSTYVLFIRMKKGGIKPNSQKTISAEKGNREEDKPREENKPREEDRIIKEASQHEDHIVIVLNQDKPERMRGATESENIKRVPMESSLVEDNTEPKMTEMSSGEVGNNSFKRSDGQNTETNNESISFTNANMHLLSENSRCSKTNGGGGGGRSILTVEKVLPPRTKSDISASSESSCRVFSWERTCQSKGYPNLDWFESDNHQTNESSLKSCHVGFVLEDGLIPPPSENLGFLKPHPEVNPDDGQKVPLKSDCVSRTYFSSGYPIETDLSMQETSDEISSHTSSDLFNESAHYKPKINVVHDKKSTVQVTDVHELTELSEGEEETKLKYTTPSTTHTDGMKPNKYNTFANECLEKQELAQPDITEELDARITLVDCGAQKAETSILDDEKRQEKLESMLKSTIDSPKHDSKTRFDSSSTSGYETEKLSSENAKSLGRESEIDNYMQETDNHSYRHALDCVEEEKGEDQYQNMIRYVVHNTAHAGAGLGTTDHNKLNKADSFHSCNDKHTVQTVGGHEHLRGEADKGLEDKARSEKISIIVKENNCLYKKDLKVQAIPKKGRKTEKLVPLRKHYTPNDLSIELPIRSIVRKFEKAKQKRNTEKTLKRMCKTCKRKLYYKNTKCLSCNHEEFKCRPDVSATPQDCDNAPSFFQHVSTLCSSLFSLRSAVLRKLQGYSHEDDLNRNKFVEDVKRAESEVTGALNSLMKEFHCPRFIIDLRSFVQEVIPLVAFPALKEYFERLEQGPISHEESMSYEWLRLASFDTYRGAASAIQLAQNGFYHDVEQGPTATRCHACKLLKTNWEFFDNIEEEHRRLSPNCRLHQAGTSGNVSIDNQPERNAPEVTEEEPVDRNTTPEVNESSEHTRNEVANITENLQGTQIREMTPEGFPQQPTEDRYNHEFTSRSTPRTVSGQETSSGPPEGTGRAHQQNTGASVGAQDSNNTATNITVTSENSSSQRLRTQVATSTPFATGAGKLRERNQGDASQGVNDPSHVNVLDPKYGEYSSVDSRAASFTSMWPSYLDQTPRQMAQAGFFYAGVADFTRCFACGGGLRNWEAGDDPCLEHTRWYPRCEYMNKLKGSVYVQAVIRRQEEHAAEQRRRQQQQRRQQTPSNTPPDPLTTPAAAVLIEMGYTSERAREAILAVRRNTGHNSVSAEQALVWILDRDELSELTASEAPTATQPTVTTTRQSSATAFNQTSTSTQGSSSATQISSASSQTSSTTVTSASGGSSKGLESNKQGQGALVTGATGGSRSSTPTRSGSNSRGDSKSENKPGEKDSQKKGANGQGNQPSGKQKKKNGKKKGKGGGAGNNGGEADANEEKVSESVVEETVNEGGAMAIKGNNSREMVSAGEPTEKDTSTLKAENKKLREMQTCKICMDKPVNMTLLPCGHLVCCESCSPHLRKCPICRRRIEGSVKTFMS